MVEDARAQPHGVGRDATLEQGERPVRVGEGKHPVTLQDRALLEAGTRLDAMLVEGRAQESRLEVRGSGGKQLRVRRHGRFRAGEPIGPAVDPRHGGAVLRGKRARPELLVAREPARGEDREEGVDHGQSPRGQRAVEEAADAPDRGGGDQEQRQIEIAVGAGDRGGGEDAVERGEGDEERQDAEGHPGRAPPEQHERRERAGERGQRQRGGGPRGVVRAGVIESETQGRDARPERAAERRGTREQARRQGPSRRDDPLRRAHRDVHHGGNQRRAA